MTPEQTEQALQIIIKEHCERIRIYRGGGIAGQVNGIINDYRNSAERALQDAKDFRDEVLTYFAGLRIVADSITSASTHSEKNARMRGLIEVLESSSEKLRKLHFELTLGPPWPDVFHSDYPTRQFVERIRELEGKVKVYESERDEIARRNIGNVGAAEPQRELEPPF